MMRRCSVKDLDLHTDVPVGDPDNWSLVHQLATSAVVMHGWIERRVAIHELREAGIWKPSWDSLPEISIEQPTDEEQIVQNEDKTK